MVGNLAFINLLLPLLPLLVTASPTFSSTDEVTSSTDEVTIPLGGPIACMVNGDGTGDIDRGVTKDCCAAVKHRAYYNEVVSKCMDYGGPMGNGVDWGAFVRCCGSRGRGSHGD
jgi:hypothetical protein